MAPKSLEPVVLDDSLATTIRTFLRLDKCEEESNSLHTRFDEVKKYVVHPEISKRYNFIRSKLTNNKFAGMNLHEIDEDMAFLSSYYSFVVEMEGLILGSRALYNRIVDDSITLIISLNLLPGSKKDQIYQLLVFYLPEFKAICDKLHNAERDATVYGFGATNATTRASSIKMLIEVFKKRHDALVPGMKMPSMNI